MRPTPGKPRSEVPDEQEWIFRPWIRRCKGRLFNGEYKGKRCNLPATRQSDYCNKHQGFRPRRKTAVLADATAEKRRITDPHLGRFRAATTAIRRQAIARTKGRPRAHLVEIIEGLLARWGCQWSKLIEGDQRRKLGTLLYSLEIQRITWTQACYLIAGYLESLPVENPYLLVPPAAPEVGPDQEHLNAMLQAGVDPELIRQQLPSAEAPRRWDTSLQKRHQLEDKIHGKQPRRPYVGSR